MKRFRKPFSAIVNYVDLYTYENRWLTASLGGTSRPIARFPEIIDGKYFLIKSAGIIRIVAVTPSKQQTTFRASWEKDLVVIERDPQPVWSNFMFISMKLELDRMARMLED